VLQRPVLYLSHYLKQHRGTYYDRLMAVRYEGAWEGLFPAFHQLIKSTSNSECLHGALGVKRAAAGMISGRGPAAGWRSGHELHGAGCICCGRE
jgi:hypothetical protein